MSRMSSKMSRDKHERSKRTLEFKAKHSHKPKKRLYVLESDCNSDDSNHSHKRKRRSYVLESDSDSGDSNYSGYFSSCSLSSSRHARQVQVYVRKENKNERINTFWSTVNVDNLWGKTTTKLQHGKSHFIKYDLDNYQELLMKSNLVEKFNSFRTATLPTSDDFEPETAYGIIKDENNYSIDQVVYLGENDMAIVHWKDHQGKKDEYGFIHHKRLLLTGRDYANLLAKDLRDFHAWRPETWVDFRIQHDTVMGIYRQVKEMHRVKEINRFGDVANFVDYMRAHIKMYRDRVHYIRVLDLDWFLYFIYCLKRFLIFVANEMTQIRAARDRDFHRKDYFDLLITLDASLFHEEIGIRNH